MRIQKEGQLQPNVKMSAIADPDALAEVELRQATAIHPSNATSELLQLKFVSEYPITLSGWFVAPNTLPNRPSGASGSG